MRVVIVAEDRNLADAVSAVVRAVTAAEGVSPVSLGAETTGGCKPARLRALVARAVERADLVVVAADAAGEGHRRGRDITYRQKNQEIAKLLDPDWSHRCFVGCAAPCAEAWLLADPAAFASALREGLRVDFKLPEQWPVPRSEEDAKQRIGDVIYAGMEGTRLARNGFEFASEILGRAVLVGSTNPSLADFASRLRAQVACP